MCSCDPTLVTDPPQISAENELKVAYRRSVFLCNTEASTRSQNLDQWSDPQLIEDPEPVLVLRTCVLNSRVYHGSASVESPAFEVSFLFHITLFLFFIFHPFRVDVCVRACLPISFAILGEQEKSSRKVPLGSRSKCHLADSVHVH